MSNPKFGVFIYLLQSTDRILKCMFGGSEQWRTQEFFSGRGGFNKFS